MDIKQPLYFYQFFDKYKKSIEKRGITFEIHEGPTEAEVTKAGPTPTEGETKLITFQHDTYDTTIKLIQKDGKLILKSQHNTVPEKQLLNLLAHKLSNYTYDLPDNVTDIIMFTIINDFHSRVVEVDHTSKSSKILFKHLIELVPITKQFCVSCGQKLPYPGDNFMSCEHNMCRYKLDELSTGDDIINMYNERPNLLMFLLSTAFASMSSSRRNQVFEPFPPKFLINSDQFVQRGELSTLNNIVLLKKFNLIDKLICSTNEKKLMSVISKATSDQELSDTIGADLYYLIRFIVKSNKTELKEIKLFDTIEDKVIQQYSIVHPYEVEEKFKQYTTGNTNYLFHGSSYENWYSILRNGIKIMSGTKLMVNAAAYGTGVYLSDSFAFSCDYSNRGHSNDIIVAVFEIAGNKEKYKQRNHIYVINNNNDLLLRYFLILPSRGYHEYNKVVSDYFGVKVEVEKKQNQNRISRRAVARIVKEYKDLINNKNLENFGIRIETIEENISKWKVYFSDFGDCHLQQDMNKYNIKEVELEVIFPENYPLYPPFFRVIRPIFCYLTGRITSGGSICVDTLTLEAWSAATRMESLLLMVKTLFVEGEGRIEPTLVGQEYDIRKAQESFRRVANQHGWKI